jgi:hypothetical protein
MDQPTQELHLAATTRRVPPIASLPVPVALGIGREHASGLAAAGAWIGAEARARQRPPGS